MNKLCFACIHRDFCNQVQLKTTSEELSCRNWKKREGCVNCEHHRIYDQSEIVNWMICVKKREAKFVAYYWHCQDWEIEKEEENDRT